MHSSYLRFGPAEVATIEGVMEGVPHDAFSGWVWDPANPDAELSVEVIGPDFYIRIAATEHRPDLAAAGKRKGNCWFKTLVPAGISEMAQGLTVALLAGTSHRLRPVAEQNRVLDVGWLDTQPLDLQLIINAQRIRFGLNLPPLSEQQLDGILAAAKGDDFDLSVMVNHLAHLSG